MSAAPLPIPLTGPSAAPRAGDGGELVILHLRPSAWFILLYRLPLHLALALIALAAQPLAARLPDALGEGLRQPLSLAAPLAILALLLSWMVNIIDVLSRTYTLTDRRIARSSGILSRITIEVPLARIQSVALSRSLRERIVGIGSLSLFSAAAGGAPDLSWFMVAQPAALLAQVRAEVDRARDSAHGSNP
ncbi:MAG: PH domain-containing protein [Phycisphaerales bacterium]